MITRFESSQFMNSQERGDNITNEQQAAQLLQRIQFSGLVSRAISRDSKDQSTC